MNAKRELHSRPAWYYNEMKHAGVDYADQRTAAEYDAKHAKFRDFKKDAEIIIKRLSLKPEHTVIDLGCGTGIFAIPAAEACRKVHAVDISRAMLDVCMKKAADRNLNNLVIHQGGFLSYVHKEEPADAVVSVAALHHLPDFWKAVALHRLHAMLKPGGKLYLFDVVFSFPIENFGEVLNSWVNGMREKADSEMGEETIIHIRDEFSTLEWIMDGMLSRSGFSIQQKFSDFPHCVAYVGLR